MEMLGKKEHVIASYIHHATSDEWNSAVIAVNETLLYSAVFCGLITLINFWNFLFSLHKQVQWQNMWSMEKGWFL